MQGFSAETLGADCILSTHTGIAHTNEGMSMTSINSAAKNFRILQRYSKIQEATRDDVADLNTMIKAEMVKCGKVSAKDTEIAVTIKESDSERMEMQGFAVSWMVAGYI